MKRKVSLDPSKLNGLVPGLDEFFSGSFRGLGILPEENCEDRSFEDTDSMSLDDENRAPMRDDDNTKDITTEFHLCHKIIIAPVVDLLQVHEIIIIPDSCMYQVPFAALSEEGGKCLLETARIFIVPSLTTLKLIQESPPEYHSQRPWSCTIAMCKKRSPDDWTTSWRNTSDCRPSDKRGCTSSD